jgi:hypothetical protein
MSPDPDQPTNPPVVPVIAPWAEQLMDPPAEAARPAAPPASPPPATPAPPLPLPKTQSPPKAAADPIPVLRPKPAPEAAPPAPEPEALPEPEPPVAEEAETEPEPEPASTAASQAEPGDEAYSSDGMPLLPRGGAIFEDIPARAVVLAELAPALQNGALVIRRPNGVGVVLVQDGALYERFCFHDSRDPLYGDAAMAEIRLWLDATVSAFRLKRDVVDMAPVLLRGDAIYEDLRLSWTDWTSFIDDLRHRDGTFVVELQTANGRGVTCISDGEHVATFTSDHPEFGDASLLDKLAASGRGTISVRCEPAEKVAFSNDEPEPAPAVIAEPVVAAEPTAPAAADTSSGTINPFASNGSGESGSNGAGVDNPFGAMFSGTGGSAATDHQPVNVTVADILPELKEIAQDRLQRSSSRVEAMLDDAAAGDKPLESVLAEIRGLVIRGVMQSTLDSVVDEMLAAATAHASA